MWHAKMLGRRSLNSVFSWAVFQHIPPKLTSGSMVKMSANIRSCDSDLNALVWCMEKIK